MSIILIYFKANKINNYNILKETINIKQFTLVTCLLSELGLDEGGEGDEVPDHVDEGHGQGEGEVDGGVGLQLQHRVQRHRGDPGVAVPLVQVVGPVHIPAPEPGNML